MTVEKVLAYVKTGKPIIIVDHADRENEGDFFVAAEFASPKAIKLMIQRGGGLVCCAITQQQANRLDLPLMVASERNTEKTGVNFTVSVNAKAGTTTGVSAFDRSQTIKTLASPKAKPEDLTIPGHVFGLVAHAGGLSERLGHTEAAVDLAKIANLNPTGVLCEIVGQSGEMANLDELKKLSEELDAPIISIDQIVEYLKQNKIKPAEKISQINKVAESKLPTSFGNFTIDVYRSIADHSEHIALSMGNLANPVTTRIHSMCLTGDTFGSLRCDCQSQLLKSLATVAKKGTGLILYLNQEGRGIGLTNKIKAYALQDQGLDTVDANCQLGLGIDTRDYGIAAAILEDMAISDIELLTNNPDKITQLKSLGIKKIKPVSLETDPNGVNNHYLATKKNKLGHRLEKV